MNKKNRLLYLSSLLVLILVFTACSGGGDDGSGSEAESPDPLVAESACNALETYTGISRQVCYTTSCDEVESTYLYTHDDKTDADSCDASLAVGVCSTIDFDTYYYEGDVDKLAGDCLYNIGTWSTD